MEPIIWNFPDDPPKKKELIVAPPRNIAVVEKPTESKREEIDVEYTIVDEQEEVRKSVIKGLFNVIPVTYKTLEVIPSKVTSNMNVRWLMADFSRVFRPWLNRINVSKEGVTYEEEMGIWWEIIYTKNTIRFYVTIPDKDYLREGLSHSIRKCWKQSTVMPVKDPIPAFDSSKTSITRLTLKYNSALSLDVSNPNYSPLDSLLNTKHYLLDKDVAMLQIGMFPYGEGWRQYAKDTVKEIKEKKGVVPTKKGKKLTGKDIAMKTAWGMGVVLEETLNTFGDLFIPGFEENKDLYNSNKDTVSEISQATVHKTGAEAFHTIIRMAVSSSDEERRKSILRAISSGFDPLSGNNEFVEYPMSEREMIKEISNLSSRKKVKTSDILGSFELAKIIQIPDQKAQMENPEELNVASHRTEVPVPKAVFKDGIPFALYSDEDGVWKQVNFPVDNRNLLCMTRVYIGEPGTGKTTAGVSLANEVFQLGFGATYIDAADGKAIQRILSLQPKERLDKVKILDFKNTAFPIGLSLSEAFSSGSLDEVEDLIAEEIVTFVELVSGTELNMTAKTWVELASKAVFRSPTATLSDVMRIMTDPDYCQAVINTLDDTTLVRRWQTFWTWEQKRRDQIFNQAFHRLHSIVSKRVLRNILLQPPKCDDNGEPIINFRKWMDEGYLVLIKVNESLQEHNVTAIVSFLLAKFNMAIISREDIVNEDDRNPCFLFLDEPDHYIKGSDRWRNMLTRYRKYRCGLVFMFHGWEQLKETDRDLPKMIRKAGPHYIIFNTDEENLQSLRFVYEPELKIAEVAKGIPQNHAIIRMKMYDKEGGVTPAFMAKAISMPEDRYPTFNNDDWYTKCAIELGRPKEQVEAMINEPDVPEVDEEEMLMPQTSQRQRSSNDDTPPSQRRQRRRTNGDDSQVRPPRGYGYFKNMGKGELDEPD